MFIRANRSVAGGEASSPPMIRVWDVFVRAFHWSLVAVFAMAWLTADEWDSVHNWSGYAAVALVFARLVWGGVGSKYARFVNFVRSPAAALGYLGDVIGGRQKRYLGHNPAGAAMILALLAGILGLGLTGWMMTLDAYGGAAWLEETHEILANGMLVLAVLHVAGVALTSLSHKENLVRSMITGRKRTEP